MKRVVIIDERDSVQTILATGYRDWSQRKAAERGRLAGVPEFAPMPVSINTYTDLNADPVEAERVLRSARSEAAKLLWRWRNAAHHLQADSRLGGGVDHRPVLITLSNYGASIYADRAYERLTHWCREHGCEPYYLPRSRRVIEAAS